MLCFARSAVVVAAAGAALIGAGVRAALADAAPISGVVQVEYAGADTESYVIDPADPAVQESKLTFQFHERASFLLGSTITMLPGPQLTISGGLTITSASKNQTNCSGTFAARAGATVPVFVIDHGDGKIDASTVLPQSGEYTQSSAPNSSGCGLAPNTGIGFPAPPSAEAELTAADVPSVVLRTSAPPYQRDFNAEGSDPQVTVSLHTIFEVHVFGRCDVFDADGAWYGRVSAASHAFQAAVFAIRQDSSGIPNQIAEVKQATPAFERRLAAAYDADLAALDDAEQALLAEGGCDPAAVKAAANAARDVLKDKYDRGKTLPEAAITAVKRNCGCGGFGPPVPTPGPSASPGAGATPTRIAGSTPLRAARRRTARG